MSDEERFLSIVTAEPSRAGPSRPNRRLAPRHVYEAKAARWSQQWPELTVLPWDDGSGL